MLLVCWKIAYVRGIRPAFSGQAYPGAQLYPGSEAGYHTGSNSNSSTKSQQLRSAGRLSRHRSGWLVPLSFTAGMGLAYYLDPGLQRTPEKQEAEAPSELATLPEAQLPRWQELRGQLQHFEIQEKYLNAELQALRALNSKSRDSVNRQKQLSKELDLLHEQRKVVLEEAKDEILHSKL